MNLLNRNRLEEAERRRFESAAQSPVTVLQIGEGNFLRGFFDWMIHECRKQGLYQGSIAVTQPRPSGKAKIEKLARQDGLYTLVTRGLANGERVERSEIVTVFSKVFDPYGDWDAFLTQAENPDLQIVVSNTTEAGLVYRPESLVEGKPVESFPGKMTVLLYRRYLAFEGDPARGLLFLPCELLERNGDELQACVLKYSDDWGLPEDFTRWVREHNRFLNSLVDRIVTGHPGEEQARSWFADWGYTDELLNTAEPYHFWAIEAEPELDDVLPLAKAGMNVVWTDDLKPYQLRKVRILNGAHTLMTPIALVHGLEQVREVMEHPTFGPYVRETVEREIIPVLPLPEEELKAYAATVFERFLNPFIRHRLSDIAMNSISKFKLRLLPSLLHPAEQGEPLPEGLVRAFAGLLRYYKIEADENGFIGTALNGEAYFVRDDAKLLGLLASVWAEAAAEGRTLAQTVETLLALSEVWDRNLAAIPGLTDAVTAQMAQWEE